MTTTDPTTQPSTPAEALRWYADHPSRADPPPWREQLRRWADELDAAPAVPEQAAKWPPGPPVDRTGYEVTLALAADVTRDDSPRRIQSRLLATTDAALAYELAALAWEHHPASARQALDDAAERGAPLPTPPEADR